MHGGSGGAPPSAGGDGHGDGGGPHGDDGDGRGDDGDDGDGDTGVFNPDREPNESHEAYQDRVSNNFLEASVSAAHAGDVNRATGLGTVGKAMKEHDLSDAQIAAIVRDVNEGDFEKARKIIDNAPPRAHGGGDGPGHGGPGSGGPNHGGGDEPGHGPHGGHGGG